MSAYRIADEPAPSSLAAWAVNPLFPFLAVMLGGTWIGFAWFAFNGFAVGSPTRGRELAWLGAGLAIAAALALATIAAVDNGLLAGWQLPYAVLLLLVAKLAATYAAYVLQSRTIEIYEYYGGVLKSGIAPLIAVAIFGDRLLEGSPAFVRLWLQ